MLLVRPFATFAASIVCLLTLAVARAGDALPPSVLELRWAREKPAPDTEPLVETLVPSDTARPTVEVPIHVEKNVQLDQSALQSARVVRDPQTQQPQIHIQFTPEGTRRFAAITRGAASRPIGDRRLAILVEGRVVSAPRVLGEIPNGQAVISGNFDLAEAERLAGLLTEAAKSKRAN